METKPPSLLITLNEDNTITASLDQDGEFHEEHFPEMEPAALQILIDKLIEETQLLPQFAKVDLPNEEKVFDSKFLKVYHNDRYYYSERLGKDSVAFILYDKNNPQAPFGLITEYKPPIKAFLTTAFGGSLDKEVTPAQIVLEEVAEEAGYKVKPENIHEFGSVMVSTQSNQMCYLFVVEVSNAVICQKKPETLVEVLATTEWLSHEKVLKLQDWKAPTIISKLLKFGFER